MKTTKILVLSLLLSGSAFGQTFSDDFEGYNVGDYIGVQSSVWTTWSGTTGGTEDAQVTSSAASSGTNSIYFSSVATNGGPQDVLLPFQATHTSGIFEFEADFNIDAGKNAYFNFQGTTTPGGTYTINCNMDGGDISIDDGVTAGLLVASSSYSDGTWFTLKIEANLTTGVWELFVDGNSMGTWANSINSVASCDLYPILNSGFYVDDISYTHGPYTLPNLNAGVTSIDVNLNLAGQTDMPSVDVSNLGQTTITSFDVDFTYNGSTITENVTGLNLASLGVETVQFSSNVTAIAGSNNMVATVYNVNGNAADDDATDDSKTEALNPVVPAPGKLVIGEEATGTWCGWCPRGAVGLADMDEKYAGYWQGIAVHNGDPMTNTVYDAGIGAFIGGYPSGLVDRLPEIDPSQFETDFLQRIVVAPMATLVNGAIYDNTTGQLQVSVTSIGQQAASGNYKIACVIVEDEVTGSGSGWSQTNYYSFQSNNIPLVGDGLDWQAQPNPVPASTMIYSHVGREIAPSFAGHPNSFPTGIAVGQQDIFNFVFNIDPTWDDSKIHIVSMLIDPSGKIDNAGSSTIAEAVSAGFGGFGTQITGVETLEGPDAELVLYPNPTMGNTQAVITLEEAVKVNMTVTDITGKVVYTNQFSGLTGAQTIAIPSEGFASGMYQVNIQSGNGIVSKKLIVE